MPPTLLTISAFQVNGAIKDQMSKVSHTSNIFLHSKIHEYTQAMVEKMPKDSNLSVIYFCNSGSEANDLAMLMARAYTGYLNIVGKWPSALETSSSLP